MLLLAASMLAVALAGCTSTDSGSPASPSASPAAVPASEAAQPATPAGTATTATGAAAEPEPDAATARLKDTVTNALQGVAAANPKPGQEQLTAALTGAGIPAGSLQVSASRTPTGLEVDAIEAAALQGADCVIGQIRDGSVVVTVLPVLATGKCFVGG
ncbi:DUF6993 domain-containing protein [Arthrobacter sp. Leaf337]|uniref:DUF6993 domain-containing protein n=1 Tax=Arthrobacter sp. Leaf337 TaxID=1736342 RepID=UPI000AFA77FB